MLTREKRRELEIFAWNIRLETLKAFKELGFGHVGGSMSIIEVLAVLYGDMMNINPQSPTLLERDWLIVSKGHAGPAVYGALALKGYFPIEELKTLNRPGTNLPSHCDRNKTIGIDMTTGSLGQGMSTAIGVALGHRLDERKNYTYLILGDGELDEGQIWEGALFAAHHNLNHLITFIDHNKKQLDGYTEEILDLGDIAQKFQSFGWYAEEVDGANVEEIYEAIIRAKKREDRPSAIIAHTMKGKGCPFAEKEYYNHHMVVPEREAAMAIESIERQLEDLCKYL